MNIEYYTTMLERNRVMPFMKDGRLVCIICYYIGNKEDLERFINTDPWDVVEDKPSGELAYIAQCITDKDKRNPALSYQIWNIFKNYIKAEYPSVKTICFRRWKNNKVYVFNKKIKGGVR
jgi:hypothetical protein